MTSAPGATASRMDELSLADRFAGVRTRTLELCAGLAPEDYVVQSMPDVSPAKWHLAHTTWFFEHFILEQQLDGYRRFNDAYHHLFNSYYYSVGQMFPRPRRGLLSRPLVKEILNYREHVDEGVARLLEWTDEREIRQLVTLGLHHEQQHQELLLTDIKHVFSCNPMLPAVNDALLRAPRPGPAEHRFVSRPGGIVEIGAEGEAFCFDNETPRHRTLLREHAIGSRLVTNGEYLDFIRDGGYSETGLWLSDGWAAVQQNGWKRPLYWTADCASEFTLGGQRELERQFLGERGSGNIGKPPARTGYGRAGRAPELLRGRCLRPLGRRAAAHGARVGSGRSRAPRRGKPCGSRLLASGSRRELPAPVFR